jgi:very-short-patch-repair endonuclease
MTEKELAAILERNPDIRIVEMIEMKRPPIPATSGKDKLSQQFVRLWELCRGPALVTELRFHPDRRWRFDFAHEASKVAIEINGGIWSNGRHVRGTGYLRDREKINAAQALGWKVFELGTGQVTLDNVQLIIEVIDAA